MAATAISVDTLPSINPATGETLGYFEKTSPTALPQIVARAQAAQAAWGRVPIGEPCARLRDLRDRMMAQRDALADAVVAESGKPRVQALFAAIFLALDPPPYFAKNPAPLLQPHTTP